MITETTPHFPEGATPVCESLWADPFIRLVSENFDGIRYESYGLTVR
jgi:hypothetical protein